MIIGPHLAQNDLPQDSLKTSCSQFSNQTKSLSAISVVKFPKNLPETVQSNLRNSSTTFTGGGRLISCYQLQIKRRPPRKPRAVVTQQELPPSLFFVHLFYALPNFLPLPLSSLLSVSSSAITVKAAVLKSRLPFVGTGRKRFL